MYSCVLIDDESRGIDTLRAIIEKFLHNDLEIVGVAADADEGFELIKKTKPSIVFLDIEMPRKTGFDMLDMFEKVNFQVIFTTGFDQYAITAIRFNALDYLLKPINITELQHAVHRAIERIESLTGQSQIQNLLENLNSPGNSGNKIPLPLKNGLEFIKIGDIERCEAHQDYTKVFLGNGHSILVSKSIKHFEELLNEYNFFRTHHSYLVNKAYVKKFVRHEGAYLLTESGANIPVSRRKKADFISWLNS